MPGINLQGSNLTGAKMDLVDIEGADLRGCKAQGLSFKRTFLPTQGHVDALGFSSKDSQLIVCDEEGLHFWDMNTHQKAEHWSNSKLMESLLMKRRPIYAIDVSSNGKWIATYHGIDQLLVWSRSKGQKIFSETLSDLNFKAHVPKFSPDNQWLIACGVGVHVWKIEEAHNKAVKFIKQCYLEEYANALFSNSKESVHFSPIHSHILVLSAKDRIVIYDLKKREEIQSWKSNPFMNVQFSPDGKKIMAWDNSKILISEDNELKDATPEGFQDVKWVTFIGKDFDILFKTKFSNVLCHYSLEHKKEIRRIEALSEEITTQTFYYQRGYHLALGTREENAVHILDLDNVTSTVAALDGDVHGIAINPPYISVWLSRNKIRKYQLLTGFTLGREKYLEALAPSQPLSTLRSINYVKKWEMFAKYIMNVIREIKPYITLESIRESCLPNKEIVDFSRAIREQYGPAIGNMALSDDLHYLAMVSLPDTIKIWDNSTQSFILNIVKFYPQMSTHVECIAFKPSSSDNSSFCIACARSVENIQLEVWEVNTKKSPPLQANLLGLMKGHTDSVLNLRFIEEGQYLLSNSLQEKAVHKWSLKTFEEVLQFSGHQDDILGLATHEKSSLLATGSVDKSIRLWNLTTGEEKGHIPINFIPDKLNLSEDGLYLLVTESRGRSIHIWKLKPAGNKVETQLLWRLPKRLNCKGVKILPKLSNPSSDDISSENFNLLVHLGAKVKKIKKHKNEKKESTV